MTQPPKNPPPYRSRILAWVGTVAVIAYAGDDQLSDGHLDFGTGLLVVLLVALASGQKIDGWLQKFFDK